MPYVLRVAVSASVEIDDVLSRGSFNAPIFMMCMDVIGVRQASLETLKTIASRYLKAKVALHGWKAQAAFGLRRRRRSGKKISLMFRVRRGC